MVRAPPIFRGSYFPQVARKGCGFAQHQNRSQQMFRSVMTSDY
jgi:hypothetical protein